MFRVAVSCLVCRVRLHYSLAVNLVGTETYLIKCVFVKHATNPGINLVGFKVLQAV